MCFSAEVSFSFAALLSLMGFLCLRLPLRKGLLPAALMPFLFAIQQFSEGLVWLSVGKDNPLLFYSSSVFLFFAFIVWPIWIPLSTMIAETVPWRKTVLALLSLLGIGLSSYYATLGKSILVEAMDNHIIYSSSATGYAALYLIATVLPMLISSLPYFWALGIVSLIGYVIADFLFFHAFISVWCFFAALLSLLLYFVLRKCSNSAKPH